MHSSKPRGLNIGITGLL